MGLHRREPRRHRHCRRFRATAEFLYERYQMTGIGLSDRKVVAAGDSVKQRQEAEPLHYEPFSVAPLPRRAGDLARTAPPWLPHGDLHE